MDTAAHLALIAVVGSLIAAFLIGLFIRSPDGTRSRNVIFCLAFLFAGVYQIAHHLALRQMGLGVTFGRHESIIHIREHPVEAALSFWVSVLLSGAVSVCGLVGAVGFALPDQAATNAPSAQDTDTAEDVAEEAVP